MAESILYNVAGNILTKLGSLAFQKLRMLRGVNDELEKLQETLSALQAVLIDAEEQQSKSRLVKDWVSKLEDVLYEIDDLMDESTYETLRRQVVAKDKTTRKQVRMLFSKFKSNMQMAHKIKKIGQRLKTISDDKNQFSFSGRVLDTVHDEFKKKRETYSFILDEEVIGRNDDKEAIIKLVLDTNTKDDITIISVVGMGGLGKTTLAQSVYNNHLIEKHFELKLWVCVSEEFDVKTIVQKLTESATKKKVESFLQMDSLQSELRKQIDGKKYLLVMDDVWNEDYEKWVSLKRLLMGGAKGSRILITTRGKRVAKTFDTTFFYPLQNLDECNSWMLFKKMTFLEGEAEEHENSNLVQAGKEIVAKLKGVPLAIRTIGRLLKEKKSQNFWLSFKDKELYQVMRQGRNDDLNYMLSILELSYKYLPANLKQCFLYCALFPKDYEIQKDELILQWRAQGFVSPHEKDELIETGEDSFMELLSRSFFQDVTKDELGNIKECKMHDLMHDLACSITRNECIHGHKNDIDKGTRHFSLSSISCESESNELQELLSKARSLRTFSVLKFVHFWKADNDKFLHDCLQLRTLNLRLFGMDPKAKLFESIIGKFKHLRYLNISHLDLNDLPNCIVHLYNLETLILNCWENIKTLPSHIKNLVNLKHLDLSSSSSLEFLPNSITECCKLEALFLHNCRKLQELPRDIKNLIRMKHLDTGVCTSLNHMPKGLGELTNLQTLSEFAVGKNYGGVLSELNGLIKLNGSLRIKNLQFYNVVDIQTNDKFLQQKSGLQHLKLEWKNSCNEPTIDNLDDVHERTIDCLQPHSNIREIIISGYGGVKLCNWLSSSSLCCLVNLQLASCSRLQHLPQFDQFPYLKDLCLRNLDSMEYIGNNDYVSSSTIFPSLQNLWIIGMPKFKRWWKGTTSFSIIFPCLSELYISGCSLHIMMSWDAPLLDSMQICEVEGGRRIEEDEFDIVPWKFFKSLSSLRLLGLSKLEYLPESLQHVSTLQNLVLDLCRNLKSLPQWIDNLASLKHLAIDTCSKLDLVPEGIHNIHSLQSLRISKCPVLEERCKKDTGEDWHKIAHIPEVFLS